MRIGSSSKARARRQAQKSSPPWIDNISHTRSKRAFMRTRTYVHTYMSSDGGVVVCVVRPQRSRARVTLPQSGKWWWWWCWAKQQAFVRVRAKRTSNVVIHDILG